MATERPPEVTTRWWVFAWGSVTIHHGPFGTAEGWSEGWSLHDPTGRVGVTDSEAAAALWCALGWLPRDVR